MAITGFTTGVLKVKLYGLVEPPVKAILPYESGGALIEAVE